ncbi:FG-GAP repeat domain-containing protein [Engelhardtia mirabilis]|uniref:FG-GAP repeat protein n=1 Tax=Engelhardtia mirabilis TaxID=2528011 RepID=A0A518BGY7_9BACT|nr:FG-GAP repeat protein [Planctomycetes bacterium Pla133]QDV00510.1 FG-GAP repeat protein [Planctomycetes bacterium Pla86]
MNPAADLDRPLLRSRCITALGLSLALGVMGACSGSQPAAPAPSLNEGSYTPDAFTYTDPHPPTFHPLGTASTVLVELAETMVVVPYDEQLSGYGTGGAKTQVWIDEGKDESFAQAPGSQGLFGPGLALRGAASGNLDDDGAKEWVAVAITNSGTKAALYSADRQQDGSVQTTQILSFDPGSYSLRDARVQLADIDGDLRDEIIVVARSNYFSNQASKAVVLVFDDPEHGASELMRMDRDGSHIDLWAWPADVDGDGRPEVVVSLAGDTTHAGHHAVRLYDLPEGATTMVQVHDWIYLSKDYLTLGVKSAVGDFDGDGKDEIATGKTSILGGQLGILLHEWQADGTIASRNFATIGDVDEPGDHYWAMTAFDRKVGHDELAVIAPHGFGSSAQPWTVSILNYEPVTDAWSQFQLPLYGEAYDGENPTLCAGDFNGDGTEGLMCGLLRGYSSEAVLERWVLGTSPVIGWSPLPDRTFPGAIIKSRTPVMVAGDWDADGVVVESTGHKFLTLDRPIPIAVLSAPPTRAGISQNYADTSTRYETGVSTTQTWGVTTGTTVAAAVGFDVDVFGLIKAGGKATIAKTLTTTQLDTTQVSYVSGYSGSANADTIIFQGTLNRAYEYRIVSAPDPDAVGQLMTVNVPVDSLTYNWTLDYFNSYMPPQDRIGDDVLSHVPGQIQSYPTFGELDDAVTGSLHWQYPAEQDVGQGAGSNDLEIAFLDEDTTETQRTVSVEVEGGVGIGVEVSGAESSESGSSYAITYSETSRFTTTVGSIAAPSEYEAWRYKWGLVVETYGRTADADNVPTGYVPGRRPFQLVRYWVDAVGSAY